MSSNLRLIVLPGHKALGEKIDNHLKKLRKSEDSFIVPTICDRFNNGEGKIRIKGSVREKDIFILQDVGNYSVTYEMHDHVNYMSPDDHYQDIKRAVSAMSGHSKSITVIMPLMYQSRQHKRKGRESLDCALALRELENLGVNNIITFDVHDPSVCNSIPNTGFDNIFPTSLILDKIKEDIKDEELLVISPDMGAMERARYYADVLNTQVGVFYKRRDLTKLVNGKNPVISHEYMGEEVSGKNVLIVDDMISSGFSILDTAKMLKEKGAKKILLAASFALFTEGSEVFNEEYKKHTFDKVYTTNLSYIDPKIIKSKWLEVVDASLLIANIINDLNDKKSLNKYF